MSEVQAPQVLDEGRTITPFTIKLHGKKGQSIVNLNLDPMHTSQVIGVADPSMAGLKHMKITKVETSHPGIVSGLSLYDGEKGPPVKSSSAGFTVSNKDGNLHMHHVALSAVTHDHPGIIQFEAQDPEQALKAYNLGAARTKYNPNHKPDEGVHIVEPGDGLPPVYLTEVDKKYPLGVLCASNPSLNKKDKNGENVYHVGADGKTYHVVEEEDFKNAQKVLTDYLHPDEPHKHLRLELNTPEPPNHDYSVTISGHMARWNMLDEHGQPMAPLVEDSGNTKPLLANNTKASPTGEIPGYPDVKGSFTMKPLLQKTA